MMRPMDASSDQDPSSGFRPIAVGEVEWSEAVPSLDLGRSRTSTPYTSARILVRLHGAPIGVVDVASTAAGLVTARELETSVRAALGAELARHLADDGLPSDQPQHPTPPGPTPRCRQPLVDALAAGPTASVIVPCADRPAALRLVLADLRSQLYPRTELIVVDNAPGRSGAQEVVASLPPGGHPVHYVVERRPGTSHARNRGLDAASGKFVAFVDADVRVDREWLARLSVPFHRDPRVGAAAGLILPSELETQAQAWMEEWGGFGKGFRDALYDLDAHRSPSPIYPWGVSFGSGTSMAFRTDVLRELGGFDTALGPRTPTMGGEDIAALLDVVLAGRRLAYVAGAIVWHAHPEAIDDLFDKLESYGVGLTAHLTRVAVRHPWAAVDIARRMPAALRYFLAPGSGRNRQRSLAFPAARVRRAEVRGMIRGPLAYARATRRRPAARAPR